MDGRGPRADYYIVDELVDVRRRLAHDHGDNSLVVVAIPSDDDQVWEVSSEKVPHLTLLYLDGSKLDMSKLGLISGYVGHAASLLGQFTLDVDRRGVLGDKNADVLFFNKQWTKEITEFRTQLLRNDLVSEAYLSTDQYPEWTPHLTLGYPETPAKKISGLDRFYSVRFDRIALWGGDYEGPTFGLKREHYEVAMSQTERGRLVMDDMLKHYGVKGMHWGVRKDDSGGGSTNSTKTAPSPRKSEDAKAVEKAFGKIDRGGTNALSNQELQHLVNRLNLEQQYSRLTTSPTQQQMNAIERGHNTVKLALGIGKTVNDVNKFMKSPAGKAIKAGLKIGLAAFTGGTSAAAAAGAQVAVRTATNHYTNVS